MTLAPILPIGRLRAAFLITWARILRRLKMLTKERAANAYEEVTGGCRRSVRVPSDNAR
jgi:hypothetical protein